ncbi:MAG: tetratricopeptide repeat protein [bacterium]|nr:tetratricopeptide repeat protein [bacterium]
MLRIYLPYALSGFLSLGFQVAWFRVFTDRFGSTNLTFAFVLANFIGGIGLGSLVSRAVTTRLGSWLGMQSQLRLYGLVEILVAITTALTLLLPFLPATVIGTFPYEATGDIHEPTLAASSLQFALSVACVFVPCFFMGVTFPLLCSAFGGRATLPSVLYAWNTVGACLGVLACEFGLLPWLGHYVMFGTLAVINLGLGMWFLTLGGKATATADEPTAAPAAVETQKAAEQPDEAGEPVYGPRVLLFVAILSGLLAGAFEADVLRRIQFFDCKTGAVLSCVSFWAILAIFLGSATVRWWQGLRFRHLQIAVTAAFAIYALVWGAGHDLAHWANAGDNANAIAAQPPLPPGTSSSFQFFPFGYSLGAVLVFTGIFVFPAFYLMSLLLPRMCNSAQAAGQHLGRLYGANTVAFCVGVVAFTTFVPAVNMFYAMRLMLTLFALSALTMWLVRPASNRIGLPVGVLAGGSLVAALTIPADFPADWFPPESPPAKYKIRALKSNGANTTYVVAAPEGDALYFDHHSMSGCNIPAQRYMRIMAQFPLLLQEQPKSALLICFGVGNTASSIASNKSIEQIDIVDLNHRVFETAPEFEKHNRGVIEDERVRLIHDDGRRYLSIADATYDLITSEPPPPMFPGVSRLYSTEYYRDARDHLTPDGMMSQWFPIDQMPMPAMRAAIASFIHVFPHSLLIVGSDTNYVIVGSKKPFRLPVLESRFRASNGVRSDLRPTGIHTPVDLLLRVQMCGPELIERFGDDPGVSDLRNDFSHVFHDPTDPPVLTFSPKRVLDELAASGLAELQCRDDLRYQMTHLGRLASLVPDYPPRALASVPANPEVGMSDADWLTGFILVLQASRDLRDKEPDMALRNMLRALDVVPEYPLVLKDTARMLTERGRAKEALGIWQRLSVADPRDSTPVASAARLLVQMGNGPQARSVLEAALQRFPSDVQLHATYADVLYRLEKYRDALKAYDRALELAPRNGQLKAARSRCLEKMR